MITNTKTIISEADRLKFRTELSSAYDDYLLQNWDISPDGVALQDDGSLMLFGIVGHLKFHSSVKVTSDFIKRVTRTLLEGRQTNMRKPKQ